MSDNSKLIPKKFINRDPFDKEHGLTGKDIYARCTNPNLTYEDFLEQQYPTTSDQIDNKLSKTLNLPIAQAGSLNYLPLDIKASFHGNCLYTHSGGKFIIERDGTIVGIRGGWDGFNLRQFYMYGNNPKDLRNLYVTDIEYKPSILEADEYISYIVGHTLDGFACWTSKKRSIWIELNKTLDASFNTTIDVSNYINGTTLHHDTNFAILNDYLIKTTAVTNSTNHNQTTHYITVINLKTNSTIIDNAEFFDTVDPLKITYLPYKGEPVDVINISNQQPLNAAFIDDHIIRVSCPILGLVTYPGVGQMAILICMCIDINISTASISIVHPFPYTFDPTIFKHNLKFYPVIPRTISTYDCINVSILRDFNSEYPIYRYINIFQWYSCPAYNCIEVSYDDQLKVNNIDPNDERAILAYILANIENSENIKSIGMIEPVDPTILGKKFLALNWLDDYTIVGQSKSRLYNDTELQTRQIKVRLPSYNPSQTIDSANDTLPNPINVQSFEYDAYTRYRCYNSVTNEWFAQSIIIGNKVYKYKDGSISVIDELPDGYLNQIQQFCESDPDVLDDPNPVITYTGVDRLYILNYGAKKGTTLNLKLVLFTNDGTNLNFISSTLTTIMTRNDVVGISNIPLHHSGGILITSDYVYILASGTWWTNVWYGTSAPYAAKIDIANKTIVSSVYSIAYPNWLNPRWSMHSIYGPCATGSLAYGVHGQMKFIDHRSIASTVDRLEACFNDLLNKTYTYLKTLYILTVNSTGGFKCFSSEFPCFLLGHHYTQPTACYDLQDLFSDPSNSKFYIYIEPYDQQYTKLSFSSELNPPSSDKLLIGELSTNDSTIENIKLYNKTFISNARIGGLNNRCYSVPISPPIFTPELDYNYTPDLIKFISNTNLDLTNNVRLVTGVCRLNQVASTIYTLEDIVIPDLSEIKVLIISQINSGDGYNHAYLDLATYSNYYTYNIVDNTFSIRVTTGLEVNTEYLWAHWIAIGNSPE